MMKLKNNSIFLITLAILFFIYEIVISIMTFSPPARWISIGVVIITYVLMGFMIVLKKNQLEDFYIDRNVVGLYLIAGLSFIQPLIVNKLAAYIPVIILTILFVFYKTWRDVFKAKPVTVLPWKFILVGILAGLVLRIAYGFLYPHAQSICSNFTFWSQFFLFGGSAVYEEILFRGFLMGFLKQKGWRDIVICMTQIALFTIPHYASWSTTPWALLIILPIFGFVAWWLTTRSKTVLPSIVFHFSNIIFNYILGCV